MIRKSFANRNGDILPDGPQFIEASFVWSPAWTVGKLRLGPFCLDPSHRPPNPSMGCAAFPEDAVPVKECGHPDCVARHVMDE